MARKSKVSEAMGEELHLQYEEEEEDAEDDPHAVDQAPNHVGKHY